MSRFRWMTGVVAGLAFVAAGCSESDSYEDYNAAELSNNQDHDHDHGGHEGLHGGHVLEIGDSHQFHAEIVFDKTTRDITVYFYGNEVGKAVPASGFVFELDSDDGEAELASSPSPLEGETEETASRYVVAGTSVPEAITGEENINGHFHVTLGGNDYAAELHAHSHDHDDHGHHDDGDDHDHDEPGHHDDKDDEDHAHEGEHEGAETKEAPSDS